MPNDMEVFGFFRKLGFKPESLKAMYKEVKEYSVYAVFKTEGEMLAAMAKVKSSVAFDYVNGQSVMVTVTIAGCTVRYVRLFGLPPDIMDSEIETVLSRYGKIFRMVRERYGTDTGYPIWNGVRGVHMEVSRDIPAMLHVLHFQARVYYDGLVNKCFTCGEVDHKKVDCPKRNSVNSRLDQEKNDTDKVEPSEATNKEPEAGSSGAPSYKDIVGSARTSTPNAGKITPNFQKLISKNSEKPVVSPTTAELTATDSVEKMETEKTESGEKENAVMVDGHQDDEGWKTVRTRAQKRSTVNKENESESSDEGQKIFKVPQCADLLLLQRRRSRSKHRKIDAKRADSAE